MLRVMPDRERPILVVDDDRKIVQLVRMYLERERYQVIEAFDGRTALDAIEAHDPALVVLDLMLPEIDGLAVVRAVRDRGDTPIIILSARGTASDRITGLGLGADDYVPKPFSPAELVLRVSRVLARSGSRKRRPAPILELNGLSVDRDRHEASVDGRPVADHAGGVPAPDRAVGGGRTRPQPRAAAGRDLRQRGDRGPRPDSGRADRPAARQARGPSRRSAVHHHRARRGLPIGTGSATAAAPAAPAPSEPQRRPAPEREA